MDARISTITNVGWSRDGESRRVALLRPAAIVPLVVSMLVIAAVRSEDLIGMPLVTGVCCFVLATALTCTPGYRRFAGTRWSPSACWTWWRSWR